MTTRRPAGGAVGIVISAQQHRAVDDRDRRAAMRQARAFDRRELIDAGAHEDAGRQE